jgi:hypothetical protein
MVVTSSRRGHVRARLIATAVVVALVAAPAACGAPPATPVPGSPAPRTSSATPAPARTPSGPPVLGIDWGRAPSVERPADGFALPSPDANPTPAPSDDETRSGHPLHFRGQAMMADVAALPSGDLVSVGYVYPGWHPQAWTSDDGSVWSLRDMGTTEFTFPIALAVGGDAVVAVGRSGPAPLAWTSRDGRSWESHPVAILGDGSVAERMTTVLATPDGFIAGGSIGPELSERHARFWRSAEGVTWEPVANDAAAFADAEVRSIAPLGAGYVAVGVVGTVQEVTGSVAWTSPDGRTWSRVDAPDLGRGRAVAVVAAPAGGLVAVGSDLDEHEAFAWTSPDGRAWTLAPGEPSRQYPGKVRMTDVIVVGEELIGVGNYVGLQRGTAISWVSRDGLTWQKAISAPVQEQGEFYAVAPGGPGIAAVGSVGAPDDYIPFVWLSPAR